MYILVEVQGKFLGETIYTIIAGFSLLFYVFGVLISQPEIPIVNDVLFPKLSGESSYLLVALLGANIMAHNFYIHSEIVQVKVSRMHSFVVYCCVLLLLFFACNFYLFIAAISACFNFFLVRNCIIFSSFLRKII